MGFIDDFLALVSVSFYISFFGLLVFTFLICGARHFVGPIAIACLYFYSAVLLMMGAALEQFIQGVILLLIFLFFLVAGTKSSFPSAAASLSPAVPSRTACRWLAFAVVVFYVFFLQFLIAKYSQSLKIDKINWVLEAGGFSYLLSLLNGLLTALAFMLLVMRSYIVFVLVVACLSFGGFVFGEKGVLVNITILIAVVIFQNALGLRHYVYCAIVGGGALLLTILFLFGSSDFDFYSAYYSFLARVIASLDGTMIILQLGLYEGYDLPNFFIFYIFDFALSKIYGISPGIGQILAATQTYAYPANGGPNDSLVNYFLLSDFFGKIWVCLFVAIFAFLLGVLDAAVKSGRLNFYSIGCQLILVPLYLMTPAFFQATGTAFLLLARYYFLLLPLVALIYFLRWVIKDASR